ncbi:MAG: DNA-binding protein [Candidatus Scalindua sp.]|nr:DNA-binding protein [Candidatus Scalindua sp.]
MVRNFTINLAGFTFLLLSFSFFPVHAFATDDSMKEGYYGINTGTAENSAKENSETEKKTEISTMNMHPVSDHDSTSLSGNIVETMNSGGYTYILLEKDGKKSWVAITEIDVAVGQRISLQPGLEMTNFTSKTLNRTFDSIIFSAGLISHQEGTSESSEPMGLGSKGTVVTPDEPVMVKKAPGSNVYTVSELYSRSKKLDKKNVSVRGKVMKVSLGIMGKNWLHIQDGTGEQKNNTHDLVVTTQDQPSVDDIVKVNGILYRDKDFGSGYKYEVIVEEAQIIQE